MKQMKAKNLRNQQIMDNFRSFWKKIFLLKMNTTVVTPIINRWKKSLWLVVNLFGHGENFCSLGQNNEQKYFASCAPKQNYFSCFVHCDKPEGRKHKRTPKQKEKDFCTKPSFSCRVWISEGVQFLKEECVQNWERLDNFLRSFTRVFLMAVLSVLSIVILVVSSLCVPV